MRILAIETSCDETGIAVVEAKGGVKKPRLRIIKNLIASQTKIHEKFGGVVPNLAKREHQRNLPVLLNNIFKNGKLRIFNFQKPIFKQIQNSKFKTPNIDVIAVTTGPGLEPALWTGINFAQKLALEWKKPLVAVNHLEGHIYAPLLRSGNPKSEILNPKRLEIRNSKLGFPAIVLLVSGGHTELVLMIDYLKYKLLGSTRDDAAGESFDKVARMLGLPYPGGPHIEQFARKGNSSAFDFPRPMINQKNFDFSFSGLKTAVLYAIRELPARNATQSVAGGEARGRKLDAMSRSNIAASFQQAAIDVLVSKTMRAARIYKPKTIILGGGVVANKALRNAFKKESASWRIKPQPTLLLPTKKLSLDNGAMIAAAGYFYALKKRFAKPKNLKADGNRNF